MSTIEAKAGTILDIANSICPDGNLLAVAETLYKEIPIFQDAVWTEANDTLSTVMRARRSCRRLNTFG